MSALASVSDLLDRSVEKLPFLRRTVTKFRFRNKAYRAAVLNELAIQLIDDPRAVELLGADFCANLANGSITVETAFIDVDKIDNLERILALIVEYLPQILAIVMKLFAASVLFLALAFSTSSANAGDHWSFPGMVGFHLRNDHGVPTLGMTREQKLDMHDALHEGRAVPSQGRSFKPVRNMLAMFRR